MLTALTLSSIALLTPEFTGQDTTRDKIPVQLEQVAEGLSEPTDLQFFPDSSDRLLVLLKSGALYRLDLKLKKITFIHRFSVLTSSEEGLLGVAFHPEFSKNKKIYLNTVVSKKSQDTTRIAEWVFENDKLKNERILLEVAQPFANHNAGQLAFGPDGFLYIGFGDGGSRGDPYNHSQNPKSYLGKMLRVDVNQTSSPQPYSIPKDNPFTKNSEFLPEIFAWGLRNPWRYCFSEGKLIVADVGQDKWEEVSIIEAGGNYGWRIREGFECFDKKLCEQKKSLKDPIFVYDRNDGNSITGGYAYNGEKIPSLKGLYVFGDFGSGRLWAHPLKKEKPMIALGKFNINPSTFGKSFDGEIFIGDFFSGRIYQIRSRDEKVK